ncbi:MAG: serine/threonine-protein kinase [Kiritimatiellae bacterium]|nr:serine/threonine-protein kinase [Kiritimatiellia bacterium]
MDETSKTVVWKAVQETLDRTVVLRILKEEGGGNPAEVKHFLALARRFARIKSDSLAAVFDIVSEEGLHYVVMEHVEGPTLEERVTRQEPLPVEHALRIAASLIVSLDQLWASAHIVHRNLKSSTIRLDPRGVAKITDFSLAIEAGPEVNATAMDDGLIVGTPCFLSPEQALGSHELNTQSDMYALGIVLYHLVTGIVPFEDLDVVSILAAHIKQQIPPPHRVRRSIPVAFSWFLHRLMMKDPGNRYANWDDVLLDIRHLLNGSIPSCVRPGEEALSTIAADFAADQEGDAPHSNGDNKAPRIRLKRKAKNDDIASFQSKSLIDEHADDIRREDLTFMRVCWGILAAWLALVFWFRAIYQADPLYAGSPLSSSQLTDAAPPLPDPPEATGLLPDEHEPPEPPPPAPPPTRTPNNTLNRPDVQPAVQPNVLVPSASAPAPTETPAPPPAGIPTLLKTSLARAFAKGDLATARQLVQATPEDFQEKKALETLVSQIPDPDALVAEYLKTRIGKPLVLDHNGKQRTLIPRAVADGVIHIEANGRGAEFPISKLTPDEKLSWMEIPKDAARHAAHCLTLMHSSRRAGISVRAADCPLLAPILIEAAGYVREPAATPPVE